MPDRPLAAMTALKQGALPRVGPFADLEEVGVLVSF